MKTIFYTIIGASHYAGCRTDEMIYTFKKFHPDIELRVFGQADIDRVFATDPRLNFYNSKATFALEVYKEHEKLFRGDYEIERNELLVVNIDADHLIFDRLDSILAADYDVACPANCNAMENSRLLTRSESSLIGTRAHENELFSFNEYIQGGLVASTNYDFWKHYEYASLNFSHKFGLMENDVLNIVCKMFPYKFKYLEGHYLSESPDFTAYYGCASLGRERNATVNKGKVYLQGKPIKLYHYARGGVQKPPHSAVWSSPVVDYIQNNLLR
ncbi:MAG TPA: hypothetical protein DCQ93_04020 [Bacteroidetes bacterium]|nr:hypothetical protein [Bacteroidota bacterium]